MSLVDGLPEMREPGTDDFMRRKSESGNHRHHSEDRSSKPKKSLLNRMFSLPMFVTHGHSKIKQHFTLRRGHSAINKSTPGRRNSRRQPSIVPPDRRVIRVHIPDDWIIPKSFNPDLSTRDNYLLKNKEFYGLYAVVRKTRDFEYHGNYEYKRQLFQDKLISDVVKAAVSKPVPWIIFTAGAMGAGKSHVMQWLNDEDHFPLPDIVQIDPDVFKMSLPEWDRFLEHAPYKAGRNTRLESGYMVEMAQEVAMQMSKNVWVDGSFRDAVWYQHVFQEIRENHPKYLIAVLYVYASTETCLKR